jgi:hypothetical protein
MQPRISDEAVAKMIPQRSYAYNKVERGERGTGYEQKKTISTRATLDIRMFSLSLEIQR